jgi:hypothetical protein
MGEEVLEVAVDDLTQDHLGHVHPRRSDRVTRPRGTLGTPANRTLEANMSVRVSRVHAWAVAAVQENGPS